MVAPHSPYSCSRDLLEASLDMAKRAKYPSPYPCGRDQGRVRNYPQTLWQTSLAFLEELGYLDHPSVFAHGVELNERIERCNFSCGNRP